MEGDAPNIYGSSPGLVSSLLGYLVGLFVVAGGFIFAARYLIGKRVEHFEREWRASHGAPEDDDPIEPPPDDKKPPSSW